MKKLHFALLLVTSVSCHWDRPPIPQCPPGEVDQCPLNQVYRVCGRDRYCGNEQNIMEFQCTPGCKCKDGYVRDGDECVLPQYCSSPVVPIPLLTPSCPKNEEFYQCAGCDKKCGNKILPCPYICIPGCGCKEGYVRNENDWCVLPEECPVDTSNQLTTIQVDSGMPWLIVDEPFTLEYSEEPSIDTQKESLVVDTSEEKSSEDSIIYFSSEESLIDTEVSAFSFDTELPSVIFDDEESEEPIFDFSTEEPLPIFVTTEEPIIDFNTEELPPIIFASIEEPEEELPVIDTEESIFDFSTEELPPIIFASTEEPEEELPVIETEESIFDFNTEESSSVFETAEEPIFEFNTEDLLPIIFTPTEEPAEELPVIETEQPKESAPLTTEEELPWIFYDEDFNTIESQKEESSLTNEILFKKKEALPSTCGLNEEQSVCVGCERTCAMGNHTHACPSICTFGCACLDGFARDDSGQCIPIDECPIEEYVDTEEKPMTQFDWSSVVVAAPYIECPVNQIYKECPSCDPLCEDGGAPRNSSCSEQCTPGCGCVPGMVRFGDQCMVLSECPSTGFSIPEFRAAEIEEQDDDTDDCPVNQELKVCTGCDITCDFPDGPPDCNYDCSGGCGCKKGYVKDVNDNCILPSQCPLKKRRSFLRG